MPNFLQQIVTPNQMVPSLSQEYKAEDGVKPLGKMPSDPLQPFSPMGGTGPTPKLAIIDSTGDLISMGVDQPWKRAHKSPAQGYASEDFEP